MAMIGLDAGFLSGAFVGSLGGGGGRAAPVMSEATAMQWWTMDGLGVQGPGEMCPPCR